MNKNNNKSWRNKLLENWRQGESPFFYLRPLSWLYAIGSKLRRFILPKISPPFKAKMPVISLGNLSVGGSGKTPMALAVANLLMAKGYKPAVLSRGYGRSPSPHPSSLIVSRGQGPLLSVEESGDEALMMAEQLPELMVVVDADRARGAETVKKLGADILILDDGFQQLKLFVDKQILLIPSRQPFGNKALIPAGPLRERISAHKYAHILINTGSSTPNEHLMGLAQGRPVFAADYKALGWLGLRDSQRRPVEFMKGRKVLAFCGLGRPESFLRSLKKLELEICRFIQYEDHQKYDQNILNELGYFLIDSGAEVLVTTAKDAVKIPPDFPLPLMYLQMQMKIDKPEDFLNAIMQDIGSCPKVDN